jgi:hypothetical protein
MGRARLRRSASSRGRRTILWEDPSGWPGRARPNLGCPGIGPARPFICASAPDLFRGHGRAGVPTQDIRRSDNRSRATIHLRVCTRSLSEAGVAPAPPTQNIRRSDDRSCAMIDLRPLPGEVCATARTLRLRALLIRAKLDIGRRSARLLGRPNRFAARVLGSALSMPLLSAPCLRGALAAHRTRHLSAGREGRGLSALRPCGARR